MSNLKILFSFLLLSVASIPAFAQDDNAFESYLNIRGQVGGGYTVGETSFSDLVSPAAALSLGYEFTPVFGLRVGASGWQAKGHSISASETYKFNYLQANLDATFNIVNIFSDYKSDRLFNPYIFAGIGGNYAFNNDEAVAVNTTTGSLGNLWSDNLTTAAGRLGVGTDIRLSRSLAFNIEVNGSILNDKFNSKSAPTSDWQHNVLAGLTYRFGSKKKTVAPVKQNDTTAEVAAVRQVAPETPVAESPAEKAPAPKAPVVEEKNGYAPYHIFFDINSTALAADQKVELNNLVAYLKENPSANVSVTGYADAKTGNDSYNKNISKNRAETVAKYLVDSGVASDRVTADFLGDSVQPFAENVKNRVVICVVGE